MSGDERGGLTVRVVTLRHILNVSVLKREMGDVDPTSPEHIDDCGLRYHLSSRHHVYLLNTLPIRQRAQLQRVGLSPACYIWAFHSEAEQVREHFILMPNR